MTQPQIPPDASGQNAATRDAWDQNAAFWDTRMGDAGNDWHRLLVAPAVESLLNSRPGQLVLDVACGNGNFSRRMASLGAHVVAIDFSPPMIEHARERSGSYPGIDFRVVDATDSEELLALGGEPFDAVVCNMAFMDMAAIQPLIDACRVLLRPAGSFVFSVQHPCFNSSYAAIVAERADVQAGSTAFSLKLSGYKQELVSFGEAIARQPASQLYFHRPLEVLLGAFFAAGFVLDGLLEPAFPPPQSGGQGPTWDNLWRIPPVLVARFRNR